MIKYKIILLILIAYMTSDAQIFNSITGIYRDDGSTIYTTIGIELPVKKTFFVNIYGSLPFWRGGDMMRDGKMIHYSGSGMFAGVTLGRCIKDFSVGITCHYREDHYSAFTMQSYYPTWEKEQFRIATVKYYFMADYTLLKNYLSMGIDLSHQEIGFHIKFSAQIKPYKHCNIQKKTRNTKNLKLPGKK